MTYDRNMWRWWGVPSGDGSTLAVLAACCESLLHLGDAFDFCVRLLAPHDERAEVAALALAGRRDARAAEPLIAWCAECGPEQRRRGDEPDANAARAALEIFKDDPALMRRLREARP